MKRNSRLWIAATAGLAALALVGLGWWLGSRPAASVQSTMLPPDEAFPTDLSWPSTAPLQSESPLQPVAESTPGATSSGREPLPGAASPAELVAMLERRARAGDAPAACRLALELNECRFVLRRPQRDLASIEQQIAQSEGSDARQLEQLEQRLAWEQQRIQRRRECAALSEEQLAAGPSLLLQAALQGHVPSMVGFARGDGIGGQDMVADPALFALYRQHAFPLWQRALQAGSADAVQVWLEALSSGGFHFLAGALPEALQDRELARALQTRIHREISIDPAPEAADTQPFTESVQGQADDLFERYFAGTAGLRRAERQHLRRLEAATLAARPDQTIRLPTNSAESRAERQNDRCEDG
jgi:hypothetical protein